MIRLYSYSGPYYRKLVATATIHIASDTHNLIHAEKEGLVFLVTFLVTWAGLLSDLKAQSNQIALYISYHILN